MRMIKNKKGSPLLPILIVLFSIGVLTTALVVLRGKDPINKEIGSKQFTLFETYQQGEQILFFVEQSGQYAAYQTVYDLAKNGGYGEEHGCGRYNNYVLWNYMEKECFPTTEIVYQNFEDVFDQRLKNYSSKFPLGDISNNYTLELIQNDALLIRAFPEKRTNLIIPIEGRQIQAMIGDEISYEDDDGKGPGKKKPLPPLGLPLAQSTLNQIYSAKGYHISSCFEYRPNIRTGTKHHHGFDFPVPTGTDVLAVADGKVVYATWEGGYGYVMKIEHEQPLEFWSVYGHLSRFDKSVGEFVSAGEKIAESGATGVGTGAHLHFEVRVGSNYYSHAVNPIQLYSSFDAGDLLSNLKSYKKINNEYQPCSDKPCDWEQGAICNQYLER